MTNKINGIDVSESVSTATNNNIYYSQKAIDELQNNIDHLQQENKEKINILEQIINILYPNANDDELYDVAFNSEYIDKLKELIKSNERLQEENEKLKTQYNCYACGNCKGKEDYINLEKHHKGLRKQFDEYVKRNDTLSLRIEELEKENEN